MRLDHLLSKENMSNNSLTKSSKVSKGRVKASLFNFEDSERDLEKKEKTCKKAQPCGGVAQLGEHLLCKQGVRSSILLISTKG